MNWDSCFGRECKLRWGYNDFSGRLIPIEGAPPNVTSQVKNEWLYGGFNLSSTDILCWPLISLSLEPSCKKLLDFQNIFDDNEYWEVRCTFWRQKKRSEKLPKYPPNCSHFVNGIIYGVDLWVQFPKRGFPEDRYEIENLFEGRSFNETQKRAKCRAFFNYDEIKEMTLEELLNFMDEIKKGKHSQDNIPVSFWYGKLSQEIQETVISNEREFGKFLSYLYCVYRKIEMKMKKTGYPGILQNMKSRQKPSMEIYANLNKAKENYRLMNRNDFLEMYLILKRLFFCYTDYIKYAMDTMNEIDEGDHLPGTKEEIKPWLEELNKWFPMKVNGEWINCTGLFIATPRDYEQVVTTLRNTTKLRNCQVIIDNDADEPYVGNENNTKILFGLVDMKEATANQSSCYFNVLELECPGECTPNLKRWICTKCGEFVSQKDMILFCCCGSKKYKEKFFICHHPNHRLRQQREIQNQPEIVHPPVPEMEANQSQVRNEDNLLSRICEQLQKIKIKKKESANPKVLLALLDLQSKNKNKEETKDILRPLQDLNLGGDTKHLIRQYLDEDN